MDISATQLSPSPNIDVDALRFQTRSDPVEAARAFEALFASLLIKEMRNTLSDGFFGSESSDVLGGLFDKHIGEAITAGSGLGIQQMVLAQVERMAASESLLSTKDD